MLQAEPDWEKLIIGFPLIGQSGVGVGGSVVEVESRVLPFNAKEYHHVNPELHVVSLCHCKKTIKNVCQERIFHVGLCTKDVHPKGEGFNIMGENRHGRRGVLIEWMSTFQDPPKYNCDQNLTGLKKNQSGAVNIYGQSEKCIVKIGWKDCPEFFKTQGTIGLPVWIGPLINIPKGFSSKMTLEVAKIGLKVSTRCML